ncbi:PREDICTED: probable methyltransferase PMT23 isoform X2 [Nelumbo nucifera]|uniref:Methyltransferase n=1 Tax=Nelumbo nucifera TaxID=4432 RepID=A0A1U8ACH2_NELNU|nr:PREDICTED: probable methyltransferase PMT23 isoform X2 [Nelumbo nucifera]
MAQYIQELLRARKYPFLCALFVLLVCVWVLLYTNDRYPSLSATNFENSQAISLSPTHASGSPPPPPPPPPPSPPPPPISKTVKKAKPKQADVPSLDGISSGSNGLNSISWESCKVPVSVDYIPCLDNMKAIKALKSRSHMEHRERHCPKPSLLCLVPLPQGYKTPVLWPRSRDMIWFNNVPHPKLAEYKKSQNWVRVSGDYFVFPGGGTQFRGGVASYVKFIEKTLPVIGWGKHTRVVLDVGCGVASFGGYLLEKNAITMSFAPKDGHEAQIQFSLERGIPAILAVIGTQRLNFPDNVYDLIHCSRCRVHWYEDGGKPLLELNRILRPGGFFIWSATPVYRDDEKHRNVWNAMVALTESICWKMVEKAVDSAGIGLVIYQKPVSNSCYEEHKERIIPLCHQKDRNKISWYTPLDSCLLPLSAAGSLSDHNWPTHWPVRLSSKPPSLSMEPSAEKLFYEDSKYWSALVSDVYLNGLGIDWLRIRNVIDMNAGYGGFAAALIGQPLWVMNVVPVDGPDTLPVIFDRGLIGVYHDWCEAFSTYPRTYDILHSSNLFGNLTQRCDIVYVVVEMDRILRPGGWILVQDNMEIINKINPLLQSLHWETSLHEGLLLVGRKGFWRPTDAGSSR